MSDTEHTLAVQDWISALGGRPAQANCFAASSVLAVGRFHFGQLQDEVEAPQIPLHYIAISLAGPLRIEARLGGEKVRARVERGQAMIMSAQTSNAWRWDRPTEEAHIFIDPRYLGDIAAEVANGKVELPDRMPFTDTRLRDTILALTDEMASGGTIFPLLLDVAAVALGRRLLRHCDGARVQASAASGLSGRQLRRVLLMVEDRLGENIRLDDLAAAAGMSRFHFVRAFKGAVGVSPYRWLTGLRISKAKELLARSQIPILEVAARLGFESQSHFGQVFLAQAGKTPSQWRRSAS